MVEQLNNKRAVFSRGGQSRFFETVFQKISVQEAADICGISPRTMRDWRRGKFFADMHAVLRLCKHTSISLPTDIRSKDRYWYVVKGACLGGKAVMEKYGRVSQNEEHRRKKWFEWWEREGKRKRLPILASKPFSRARYSQKLAEFIGIMLGNGGMSNYQLTVTLHYKDDREYIRFVASLIQHLFHVPVYHSRTKLYDSVITLVVSRVGLVRYCVERFGLKVGNKVAQQVDIPTWVKQNKRYSIACLRGLVDTDGSVFTHRYQVNGTWYAYKKLDFTSMSKPLVTSVFRILQDIGLHPRIASGRHVRLDRIEDMKQYFRIVGTHNLKHLKRYQK